MDHSLSTVLRLLLQLEALRVILNLNILDMGKSAKLLSIRAYTSAMCVVSGSSVPSTLGTVEKRMPWD